MIGHLEGPHRPARLQLLAEILGQAFARPILAALGDHIFEPGVSAIAAVAPVAMQPHHRRDGVEQVVGFDKGDRSRHARIGLRLVVGHAVTAAQEEIVAGELVLREQGDDAEIVGQDIDGVVLGDRETDLELPRQVSLAIEGIDRLLVPGHFLPVDPDLVIGAGLRQQMHGQPARIVFEPAVHGIADWRRHRRYRAHDIAAGG